MSRRRPRVPGTRGTSGMKRLRPGDRALLVVVDWSDPELTDRERRLARARVDCDLAHRCPICGAGDGFSETVDPGQLKVAKVEHAGDCPVAGAMFARLVVAPFWRRVGRPPRFAATVCVVSPVFELEPVEVAMVVDPRKIGMCPPTLNELERGWEIDAA